LKFEITRCDTSRALCCPKSEIINGFVERVRLKFIWVELKRNWKKSTKALKSVWTWKSSRTKTLYDLRARTNSFWDKWKGEKIWLASKNDWESPSIVRKLSDIVYYIYKHKNEIVHDRLALYFERRLERE